MAKTLELQFKTDSGAQTNITLDAPKEPIDPFAIRQAMEEVIAADVFLNSKGKLVEIKGARVIERTVTEYEI